MFDQLQNYIISLNTEDISKNRKNELDVLSQHIQETLQHSSSVNLIFICTHNSRRSHLTQIWAQTMAHFFHIPHVHCYSGGTEVTAMFPKVVETLKETGFEITPLSANENPIYAVKYNSQTSPIICFSKKFDHSFNPDANFAAIMTCSSADANCPFIPGAKRISLTYEDPKKSDGTPQQSEVYRNRSKQIATEMKYVFSQLK